MVLKDEEILGNNKTILNALEKSQLITIQDVSNS